MVLVLFWTNAQSVSSHAFELWARVAEAWKQKNEGRDDSRICGYDESTKFWDISTRFWRYDSGHPIYNERAYYTFAKIRPYLGPTVRPKHTIIYIAGDSTYYPKQIEEMESISYLWRDGRINIFNTDNFGNRIGGKPELEDFQPVFNSPTLLQCQHLSIDNAHFSFKDYKVLYTVKFIQMIYHGEEIDLSYWVEFFEQPGVKPVVIFRQLSRESLANVLDQFSMPFSSAVSPNAFKIVFVQQCDEEELTLFRKTNNTSGEILELKEVFPWEDKERWYLEEYPEEYWNYSFYALERSSI